MNYDDAKLPNLKILVPIAVRGVAMLKGRVIPKTDIAVKSDWQELIAMSPPRVEQTDEPVNADDYDTFTGKLAVRGKRSPKTALPGTEA